MYGFFLQWLFQSAARDVINFIHTLWMLCLEKMRENEEGRCEKRGKKIEGKREREAWRGKVREREKEGEM